MTNYVCIFGVSCVDLLGHRLEQGVLGLDEENVETIKNAPRPGTKKQVRSFVGLAIYYRDFIPNFEAIAAPLSDLARKGQPASVAGVKHKRRHIRPSSVM